MSQQQQQQQQHIQVAFRHEWSLPTARDPSRSIAVAFLRDGENGGFKKAAITMSDDALSWTTQCREDFEVLHGVSRLVRLVPDKLATAIAIAKERLSSGGDDGSFLVDLMAKLLQTYRTKAAENHPSAPRGDTLLDNLDGLAQGLDAFRAALAKDGPISELEEVARNDVVETCDRLLQATQVYLDFVHPVYVALRRGRQAEDVAAKASRKLETFFSENAEKLGRELEALLAEPEAVRD